MQNEGEPRSLISEVSRTAARNQLRLTDDDDPSGTAPWVVTILRTGLTIGERPAMTAVVEPPLEFGDPVSTVVLASRRYGVTIDEIVNGQVGTSNGVFVCQYIGAGREIPDQLSMHDVRILF